MKSHLETLLALVELRHGIDQHCMALRATVRFLETGNLPAAIARLDGAVASLESVIRGQCAGLMVPCPMCEKDQDTTAWLERHQCEACGAELVWPPKEAE